MSVTSQDSLKDLKLDGACMPEDGPIDRDEARRYVVQGLWWQRVRAPVAATVRPALEWALEIVGGSQRLPPIGFVADVGRLALGEDWESGGVRGQAALTTLPVNLLRTYEDHVLGKIYADSTFARGSDALRTYPAGRPRARGLAYILEQFGRRSGFTGEEISPGLLKSLLEATPEAVLEEGRESLVRDGPSPLLQMRYEGLIAACRRTAEVLGAEDLFELESGTALSGEGDRLALRQVLRTAAILEVGVPKNHRGSTERRREAATRFLDEDAYPVGGFTSLSTRGSVESLLHSQLAYMEPDGDGPDLFDIKFLRDELLYYSRDENQFFRRRRTFVFVLNADLTATRFKDAGSPYQRGVLLLGFLTAAVRRLSELLTTDALLFEFVFVSPPEGEPLEAERALLERVFREATANGTVKFASLPAAQIAEHCKEHARRSLCHCIVIGLDPKVKPMADVVVTVLKVDGPRPALCSEPGPLEFVEGEDVMESWCGALSQLLQGWL